jgi:NAD dependent epimerase/dehydratase family enzyme
VENSKVLIAGGSGLVGTFLSKLLSDHGFEVSILSRNIKKASKYPIIYWNPSKGEIDQSELKKFPIVINLAGAGIADKRWTANRKKEIIQSRVLSNAGETIMTEESPVGNGFLAETTKIWEEAVDPVPADRKAIIRIGIVLSNQGGALPQMMMPIKFGIGNYFNDGSQYTSWIHIEDLCQQFLWIIKNKDIAGIYNGVAPNAITQKDWIKSILKAHKMNRLVLPVPGFIIKLVLGEMAAVVLEGAHVSSAKIEQTGFKFLYPKINDALIDIKERNV